MKLTCLFLFAVLAFSFPAAGQKPTEDWLPITEQEQQVLDAPPPWTQGVSAIQLYFSYYKDDNEKFISVYKRIKVLKEAGKKYADVEIELQPGTTLKQLAARTVHSDGTIIEYKGAPFQKTIFKSRGVNYVAETFTFPSVTLGSIIEYRYVLGLPPHFVDQISIWPIQHDLFTLKEDLRFRAFQGVVEVPTERKRGTPHSQVSYTYVNQVDPAIPEKSNDNVMRLQLTNVPPFQREEYMPPEDEFKPEVFFYYGGRETASPDTFWDEWARIESEYKQKFIGNFQEVRNRAAQAIGSEADPEKKLRLLYAAAQQIRNLSYERSRTEQERKRENLKPNRNAADVLSHEYGSDTDINYLFVAMARAAGFDADVLEVPDRSQRSFNKMVLSLAQFDAQIATVKLNGKDLILDPGTMFCPFGMVRWRYTAVQAMKFSREGAEFVTTPGPLLSLRRRQAVTSLALDGSLQGDLTVEMNGEDALEHRLEVFDTDQAGRRKRLEEEVQSWLPPGSTVKLRESNGWGVADAPLTARFNIAIPSFASIAGKRLVTPSLLFTSPQKQIFANNFRRYPISFAYPFEEKDEVSIKLPAGYSVEAAPYPRKADLSYGGYEITSTVDNGELTTRRSLRVDAVKLPPEQYAELKEFFNVVQGGDAGECVLHTDREGSDNSSSK